MLIGQETWEPSYHLVTRKHEEPTIVSCNVYNGLILVGEDGFGTRKMTCRLCNIPERHSDFEREFQSFRDHSCIPKAEHKGRYSCTQCSETVVFRHPYWHKVTTLVCSPSWECLCWWQKKLPRKCLGFWIAVLGCISLASLRPCTMVSIFSLTPYFSPFNISYHLLSST